MQTFLPFEDFQNSARVLDNKRLNKQILEGHQILKAIETGEGWIHHPITKMWKPYPKHLSIYINTMIQEWWLRGFQSHQDSYFDPNIIDLTDESYPEWLGERLFHDSHKTNLVRKDPTHYRLHFGPGFPASDKYVWYDMEKQQFYIQQKGNRKRTYI